MVTCNEQKPISRIAYRHTFIEWRRDFALGAEYGENKAFFLLPDCILYYPSSEQIVEGEGDEMGMGRCEQKNKLIASEFIKFSLEFTQPFKLSRVCIIPNVVSNIKYS